MDAMHGSRLLAAAVVVFGAGLLAAVYAMDRFSDAYGWVAHTSDVRMVIGRLVGDAGREPDCAGLRGDVEDFARLTVDNPTQQARLPALRGAVEEVCAGEPQPELIDRLGDLDATERELLVERRAHLADTRAWAIAALAMSMLGAIGAVAMAGVMQRRAVRAVTESEERFRMMATSSRDLLRIHDPNGKPTYVSPSVERVLGYTPEEMLAAPALSLGHPDDLDKMRATLTDVQANDRPGSTLIYRLRAKDASYRWFETHTNPVRDRDGKLLRFYTTARDITDRVELEKKLEAEAVTDELTGLYNRRGFLLIVLRPSRSA
jgi:PAS domain S-box-containing protein